MLHWLSDPIPLWFAWVTAASIASAAFILGRWTGEQDLIEDLLEDDLSNPGTGQRGSL